ncbi:hypothetical protein Ccrd_020930 [Cynara cardunculus var. scolymus]|uniref:Uncharacterized protein n=1 Tax=Cynara cardunculus var. scolymus TaxID=59895 RepID=A0A103Y1M5_CYNCS|nr:hypothetical protein Ccrd_020930 [Cynara cardunculus var. scolymus]
MLRSKVQSLLICQLAAKDMGQDNYIGPVEHVREQDTDTVGTLQVWYFQCLWIWLHRLAMIRQ